VRPESALDLTVHKTTHSVRGLNDASARNQPERMNPPDTETLRASYVASRQQLFTYALSITENRESAEDAIQGAFQQILRRRALPADLRPYVYRCVRNAAVDVLRRARVRRDSIFDVAGAAEANAPDAPLAHESDELERCLRQLSPDEREDIVLKIYDDFSFDEIAELRQVPLPTAASWYRRGLDKLKAMLAADIR
jgi:RNA polymerase sigma-70 factor (ECF subfamily)